MSAAVKHTPLVCVKALEWRTFEDDWWHADTIVGGYEVRQGRASARVRFPQERQFEPFDGTIDEAKAAAQADYECRILSAVEIAPDPVREKLVEALEACARTLSQHRMCGATVAHDESLAAVEDMVSAALSAASPSDGKGGEDA